MQVNYLTITKTAIKNGQAYLIFHILKVGVGMENAQVITDT
jgi:hypothetical protein